MNKVGLSYEEMLTDDFAFDMDSHDVMVFLHMQKTGLLLELRVIFQTCAVIILGNNKITCL